MAGSDRALATILTEYCLGGNHSDETLVHSISDRIRTLFPKFCHPNVSVMKASLENFGVFANSEIPAGTLVLVDHPMVSVFDVELGCSRFCNLDGGDSLTLFSELVNRWSPSLEASLQTLYPLRGVDLDSTEVDPELQSRIREISGRRSLGSWSAESVFRAVQLNSLAFYTLPELCTYDKHFRFMTGTGLYSQASMFNHSCSPNVVHYSFGDVAFFRVSENVLAGEELCISYIGSDLLRETKSVRDEFLKGRDFHCQCSKCLVPDLDDPWKDELDMHCRIAIRMAPTREARIQLIEELFSANNFIYKDRLELEFLLCREWGSAKPQLWRALLDRVHSSSDLLSLVVRMHYMSHFGYDANIWRQSLNTARICLGDLGTPELVRNVFASTDFAEGESLHAEFEHIWNG